MINIKFLRAAKRIKFLDKVFKNNFRIVRYEDLAYNTTRTAKYLFNFFDIPFVKNVKEWIYRTSCFQHDTKEKCDFDSARSRQIATKWRLVYGLEDIKMVDEVCKNSVLELGFRVFDDVEQYRNMTVPIVEKIESIPYNLFN
jgi:hypothetical protein